MDSLSFHSVGVETAFFFSVSQSLSAAMINFCARVSLVLLNDNNFSKAGAGHSRNAGFAIELVNFSYCSVAFS